MKPMVQLIYHGIVRPLRKALHVTIKGLEAATDAVKALNVRYITFVLRKGLAISYDSPDRRRYERYYAHLKAVIPLLKLQPTISILMPVYKVPIDYLRDALQSVAIQTYDKWQLCVVDDASQSPEIEKVLAEFAAAHPGKVSIATNPKNVHISATTNRCLELAKGEFVVLLDHDDRIYPHALSEVVRHINFFDDPDLLYSDSRPISAEGNVFDNHFFKPDWSPFMHLAFHYTAHMSVYRTELMRKVGGLRVGFEGSQDYDLMLRLSEATEKPIAHIPFCLYQWRVHENSTASGIAAKPYAINAAVNALTEACIRRGRAAPVEFETVTEHYRIRFPLPDPRPLVSILMPTRNGFELIQKALTSIFEKTSYPAFEIVVIDNGSEDPQCLQLFKDMAAKEPKRFRVITAAIPFNFGLLNNLAAREARGEYLLLLNNDTEVISPDWIDEMLRYCQFPEVGAVGAKLLFADGTIQHAGLLLLGQDVAGSAFEKHPAKSSYYYNLINTPRETSAVTAACMLVKRSDYEAIGGFDEVSVPNGYGDVDFCLKLRERGLSVIYTPYAELYHLESKTRGPSIETFERTFIQKRWGQALGDDPFLNFNLIRRPHFELSEFPRPELSGEDFAYFLKADR